MIEVAKAPPFATVQDLGWRTGRAMGLPRSGAMDPGLLQRANHALGNPPDAAAIEWALGPGRLRFESAALIAVTFGASARLDGVAQHKTVIAVPAGGVVEILPGLGERFTYVTVTGGIDVPPVLGSRSTYLPGGFGGFQGRRLQTGDRLTVGPKPALPAPARLNLPLGGDPAADVVVRVMRGPQWDRFESTVRDLFFASRFTVTATSDRMGYRLAGPLVPPRETATLPSEPACPGAVQIPDGGQPIVLMPDGPTVGGYPKLAVVIGDDLSRLAQCQPGRGVRFREV